MTPAQVRMARAALNLSTAQLATKAVVSVQDVEALEEGGGSPDRAAKLRATFEGAGVEFMGEDGVRHHAKPGGDAGRIAVESLSSENDE